MNQTKDYELTTAVFEVRDCQDGWNKDQTLCAMRYVRLDNGLSRGTIIPLLQKELSKRHQVPLADVMFRFWCDTYEAQGGSPTIFTWNPKTMAAEVRS